MALLSDKNQSFNYSYGKVKGQLLQLIGSCVRNYRHIYIGKNQNPKNLGFLLYRLHCQKNP